MADITDKQAIRFANERIRPVSNKLAQVYYQAKQIVAEWTALGGSSLIANDAEATLIDGSAVDGRPSIVGSDVNNIINRLAEIITSFEDSGSAKLNTILKVAPNPGG